MISIRVKNTPCTQKKDVNFVTYHQQLAWYMGSNDAFLSTTSNRRHLGGILCCSSVKWRTSVCQKTVVRVITAEAGQNALHIKQNFRLMFTLNIPPTWSVILRSVHWLHCTSCTSFYSKNNNHKINKDTFPEYTASVLIWDKLNSVSMGDISMRECGNMESGNTQRTGNGWRNQASDESR